MEYRKDNVITQIRNKFMNSNSLKAELDKSTAKAVTVQCFTELAEINAYKFESLSQHAICQDLDSNF